MRYKTLLILLTVLSSALFAKKYYVRHLDGKEIIIINENHEIVSYSLNNFLQTITKGDTVLFKRGEYFKIPVKISFKKDITIKDYGSKKLPLPILDPRVKIPLNSFEKVDIFDLKKTKKDSSILALEKSFKKNNSILATHIRNKIVKNFESIKENIHQTLRIKIDKNIEKNTIRVWIDNKEILKANLFEELRCDKCEEKIRWSFDDQNNYLYIFILDSSVSFKENSFVKINSFSLDSLSLENDENITIKNLDIRGSKYAIGIRGSKDILIENCKIGKYSFTGIDIMRSLEDKNIYSENITIKNSVIDSGFKKKYRYLSQRGVQDGIFMVDGVKNCQISNNKILNWGHSAINLYAPSSAQEVKNNQISFNTINGKDVSYMHGITVDGKNCIENKIVSNVIKNITARNQLNGIKNIFKENVIYNVKNSIVKLDQGYPSGQGIQLQAYGKENVAIENIIEKNIFNTIEGAAISIINYKNDGLKKDNTFKNNFITKSGTKNNDIALEILDFSKNGSIKNNNFIKNSFKNTPKEPKVNYFGKILSIEMFNEKNGDIKNIITDNKIIY